MELSLENWIDECIKNGTFADRDEAIEFCVCAVRTFCETIGIDQQRVKNRYGEGVKFPLTSGWLKDQFLKDAEVLKGDLGKALRLLNLM